MILAQAIPRSNRLDTILEKGTELGVDIFWFFPSKRSEKQSISLSRARTITISSMKQCGRLFLPEVYYFEKLINCPQFKGKTFFGDTRKKASWLSYSPTACCIFIGPEKGFTVEEMNVLEEKYKAKGIKLHENTLRTDTAAIAAIYSIFIFQHLYK